MRSAYLMLAPLVAGPRRAVSTRPPGPVPRVHAGGAAARVPPVTSVTARRNCPDANGKRSSGSVRVPAPLTERSTNRSAPASGRTSDSPLLARHTACVTATRAPSGRSHSPLRHGARVAHGVPGRTRERPRVRGAARGTRAGRTASPLAPPALPGPDGRALGAVIAPRALLFQHPQRRIDSFFPRPASTLARNAPRPLRLAMPTMHRTPSRESHPNRARPMRRAPAPGPLRAARASEAEARLRRRAATAV